MTTLTAPTRPDLAEASVLVLDDEQAVVDGLRRQLHGHVQVSTATDPYAALAAIEATPGIAVVVSDMRMPHMNGAEFLREVRRRAPDTVRVLLTGQADIDAAVAAVNDGGIFRFLWKPCPPDTLLSTVRDAVAQHRLVTTERELLERTLVGSVEALLETLSLANPIAFSRAERIKRRAVALAAAMHVEQRWHIEIAVTLSQIGAIALPSAITERLHQGQPLTPAQREQVDLLPERALTVLGPIPRLEPVREAIRYQRQRYDGRGPIEAGLSGDDIPLGARILRVAVDHDTLDARGTPADTAIETLRAANGAYDPKVLDALEQLTIRALPPADVVSVSVHELRIGSVLADDVRTPDGLLLCGKGQHVSATMLARLHNWSARDGVAEPILAHEPPAHP